MRLLLLTLILLFAGCSSQKVTQYADETPKLKLRDFFNGKLSAHGIVQNRSGEVIQRFNVDIDASWDGDIATLDEDFVYSDKTTSKRVWKLKDLGKGMYSAVAGDVVGTAKGQVSGNAFHFRYTLNVPVEGTTYEINFDDWMHLINKRTMIARTYMTKFGVNVGEVTLVMINEGL